MRSSQISRTNHFSSQLAFSQPPYARFPLIIHGTGILFHTRRTAKPFVRCHMAARYKNLRRVFLALRSQANGGTRNYAHAAEQTK